MSPAMQNNENNDESTPLLRHNDDLTRRRTTHNANGGDSQNNIINGKGRDIDIEAGANANTAPSRKADVEETPVPWRQFSILLFLQLAEPLTSQVIYPFLPELIGSIGITNGDNTKIAFYVGVLQSLFFLTQSFTVLHWSRLSDIIGRKPVVLTGVFGLSLSMYLFGLSRTFWALVVSRALAGALNGNIGVIKSILGEITDETNVARTFAYQPIAWSTGSTLGPLIGGSLSRPADRFPQLFGHSQFLRDYPYFLPCAIPATFSIIAWIVTYVFLEETNPTSFSFTSYLGLEKIKKIFTPAEAALKATAGSADPTILQPNYPILTSESRTYSTISSSSATLAPSPSGVSTPTKPSPSQKAKPKRQAVPLRTLLTPRVILAASNYAFLSLLDISYRALQPVFFSLPTSLGGLSLSPPLIGQILAALGIMNGLFLVLFFAKLNKKYGSRWCYLVGIKSGAGVFLTFVGMTLIIRTDLGAGWVRWAEGGSTIGGGDEVAKEVVGWLDVGYGGMLIWLLIFLQLVFTVLLNMCYASIFIYITASAPSKQTLGATNGLAQTSVSIMRAVGPAVANSLFSFSLNLYERNKERCKSQINDPDGFRCGPITGYITSFGWLVYAVMLIICAVSYWAGTLLPTEVWKRATDLEEHERNQEESRGDIAREEI